MSEIRLNTLYGAYRILSLARTRQEKSMVQPVSWNPALEMLPLPGIRRMFNLAATMKDVIHLSIGQPDFPTPAPIIEAHVKALREDKTHYTMDAGLPELLEALAAKYSARD